MSFVICGIKPGTGPAANGGWRTWSCVRDEDGHRTYKIVFRVRSVDPLDGPALALQTPNLPQAGDTWDFGNDVDVWAFCRQPVQVRPVVENEPNVFFDLEYTFSTKPDPDRCKSSEITDPLLVPQEVSGAFNKFTEQGIVDRHGERITNSAYEPITGPQNEWDASRPTVHIKQNVALLDWDLVCMMMDTVNESTLWGFPPRSVKLSNAGFDRKFYGDCSVYYTRWFEFEIRHRPIDGVKSTASGTGTHIIENVTTEYENFDRDIMDEGTKVLHGRWDDPVEGAWNLIDIDGSPPNFLNPSHFDRFQDRNGNPARVILDGLGKPALVRVVPGTGVGTSLDDAGTIHIEKYGESDFLLLGIPISF